MILRRWLERVWYGAGAGGWLLLPLSLLFIIATAARRLAYRSGMFSVRHPGVPVVVVGNISVGGTGKTPLVIWLARTLAEQGVAVGVVSRGYGAGRGAQPPMRVSDALGADEVGDEPMLIAARTGVPVVVGRDRFAAAAMLARDGVELIIADDGLQHYALGRDVEIAVVDGRRRFGNGRLLPAGPLREPVARLDVVDRVVINGGPARGPSELRMDLAGDTACNLVDGRTMSLADAAGLRWHALAGIGDPERFFGTLEASGLALIRHPFPDHAPLTSADLEFGDELPVIMTEKDAVKCRSFADARCWVLPVEACFAPGDAERLLATLLARRRNHDANKG